MVYTSRKLAELVLWQKDNGKLSDIALGKLNLRLAGLEARQRERVL